MHHPPDILLFFGRFHVLLVHLPIGMLMALATMEITARFTRFKNVNANAGFVLAITVPTTVLTAFCGWLLSLAGGYSEELLKWHERMGIGTAVGCVLAAIFFWRGKMAAYRMVLFIAVMAMTVAGHLGGSLTHGSDYLFRYAPEPIRSLFGGTASKAPVSGSASRSGNFQNKIVFAGVIEPIFQDKCVNCHGPQKSKGGLRLDSFSDVKAGGDDGLILDATVPTAGELLRRVLLPTDDDDHMPPSGKPQLTKDQIALLKWWVIAGAPETNELAELQPPPEISKILSTPPPAK